MIHSINYIYFYTLFIHFDTLWYNLIHLVHFTYTLIQFDILHLHFDTLWYTLSVSTPHLTPNLLLIDSSFVLHYSSFTPHSLLVDSAFESLDIVDFTFKIRLLDSFQWISYIFTDKYVIFQIGNSSFFYQIGCKWALSSNFRF